jgi:hypothetical protein
MKKGLFTPALFGMEWYSETDKKYSNIYARLPLPPDIQSKRDLSVKITQTRLVIQFVNTKEPEMVVDALFARAVDVDESTWTIEEEDGKRFLVFLLAKKHNGENWPSLFAVEKNSAQEEVKIVAAKSSLTPEQIGKTKKNDRVSFFVSNALKCRETKSC